MNQVKNSCEESKLFERVIRAPWNRVRLLYDDVIFFYNLWSSLNFLPLFGIHKFKKTESSKIKKDGNGNGNGY